MVGKSDYVGCCLFSSDQNQQSLAEFEQQLLALKEERDDALLKMTNAQEQADMNAEAMKNLQSVLEQFQRGTVWLCLCWGSNSQISGHSVTSSPLKSG